MLNVRQRGGGTLALEPGKLREAFSVPLFRKSLILLNCFSPLRGASNHNMLKRVAFSQREIPKPAKFGNLPCDTPPNFKAPRDGWCPNQGCHAGGDNLLSTTQSLSPRVR
jgi:hypothetical protein